MIGFGQFGAFCCDPGNCGCIPFFTPTNPCGGAAYIYLQDCLQDSTNCCFPNTVVGCTDTLACNYDSLATWDDSSCVFSTSSITNVMTCDSYNWDSMAYTTSGMYTNLYTNVAGCDSVHTLNLTINNSTFSTNSQLICFGQSITVGTSTYTISGTYTDVLAAANSCDSTVTTTLTINPPIGIAGYSTGDVTCSGGNDGSIYAAVVGGTQPYYYFLDSILHSEDTTVLLPGVLTGLYAGMYCLEVIDSNGCITPGLYFFISEPELLESFDTLNTNSAILWNGNTLNVSGDYSDTLINSAGCDSIANLNLTITIPSGILDIRNTEKTLLKITDMLGQETPYRRNTPLFYIYDDGTVEKRIVIE